MQKPRHYTSIEPGRSAPDKPFTDPLRVDTDVATLRHMWTQLGQTLNSHAELQLCRTPFREIRYEAERRTHQVVLTRPRDLRSLQSFVVVGFFGQMRAGAETVTLAAVHKVDEELIGDFPRYGGMLSYSSLLLENGDWGNMAVFRDMRAMERWRVNRRHTNAIRDLAARHYDSIRLHICHVNGGINEGLPQVERTKFYHYDGGQEWRGVCEHA